MMSEQCEITAGVSGMRIGWLSILSNVKKIKNASSCVLVHALGAVAFACDFLFQRVFACICIFLKVLNNFPLI